VQLNWSTFVLEIVNFLVLVWILKRFLYKPVLTAIGRRKSAIDQMLSEADAKRAQAEALDRQYQSRLSDWERDKEGLRAALDQELRIQRERLMAELQNALQQERDKEHVLAERRQAELENIAADRAIARGVQFTARLLQRVATPELEARLVTLVAEDLPQLPGAQIETLRGACRDAQRGIKIASAFPLVEDQQAHVIQALREIAHENIAPVFEQDPSLIAGLCMSAGPWSVRANLRDELGFFAEMARNDSR